MLKFENKSNGRFYYLEVERDMINDFVLTIIRGGKRVRVVRHRGFDSANHLNAEITRLTKRRLKRGYELVT